MLPVDEGMRSLIMERASSDHIKHYAKEHGQRTMMEHGMELVTRGLTTLDEVIRVTKL
jgi:type II secretory ATPase GspE/PulE/Tfp pilus assembly ATPase PilB-like protein